MPPLPSSGKYGSPMPVAPAGVDEPAATASSERRLAHRRSAGDEAQGDQHGGEAGEHGCNLAERTGIDRPSAEPIPDR